ncbi:MAG: EscU/YscU/HrcU family type III secretion system export apparatus switch protein [Cellulosilyticaceae bacterium]
MKKAAAITYNEEMKAPQVVAKGQGEVAENILEQAKAFEIPVYEDKELVTLLTEVEIGEQIPPELYDLVAKILVFVGDIDELYAKCESKK